MIVGGYSLHLYCDNEDLPIDYGGDWKPVPAGHHRHGEFPHEIDAESRSVCVQAARARGWKFHRDGRVSCPRCNRRAGR